MLGFIIGFVIVWIWLAYEIWRAPLLEMDDNGNWITKKPTKRLKDLFKKKQSGTYEDLQKLGRGRSKY